MADFWRAVQPGANFSFPSIDREVLRLSLEKLFRGQYGRSPSPSCTQYLSFVENVIRDHDVGRAQQELLVRYLCRVTDPDDHSLFRMSAIMPVERDKSAYSVISRATLLSRVATGAAARLLVSAGFTGSSVSFWINELGNARGYWNGPHRGEISDLWADIRDLVSVIDDLQATAGTYEPGLHTVLTDFGSSLTSLGSCERIAILGFSLP